MPTNTELPASPTSEIVGMLQRERRALAHVVAGLPLADVLAELVLAIEDNSGGLRGSILLVADDGQHLRFGAGPSLDAGFIAAIDGMPIGLRSASCGTAAFTGAPVYVADIARDPLWERLPGLRQAALAYGLRACWSTPIRAADGRVLGTFANYFDAPRHPSAHELDSMAFITRTAALVIERHQLDRRLHDSEDHYRHAVDLNPQTAWTAAPDGQLDHVGERWRQWTGTSGLGGAWVDAIHPDDLAPSMRAWMHSTATGEPYDIQHRARMAGGHYHWMHSRAWPRRDAAGTIVKWYGSTEDIHDKKLIERALLEREAQLQRLNATLEDSVRARTNELTDLTRHLQTAQEEERSRLARELHDELGAIFTTAKMDAARLKARVNELTPEIAERLSHLIATLDSGIALKRRIIEDLRPSALSNLGLVHALQILSGDFARSSGLDVDCEVAEMKLTPAVQLTIYRLVQEALSNAHKFAQARRVRVELAVLDPARARVSVSDDGVGFNPKVRRLSAHGLTALRYRVEAEGGELFVDSASAGGTRVAATLPLLIERDDLPTEITSQLMGLRDSAA